MELASIWLQLDKHGNTVLKHDVTPAEALFLSTDFEKSVNGKAVKEVTVTGKVERTNMDELARLKETYQPKRIEKVYAGISPQLPQTFKEIASNLAAKIEVAAPAPVATPVAPAAPVKKE